jgi:hypothetical protein
MNGCAPHLNASRIEDDQHRDDQLRSAMEPGGLTTRVTDEERAVTRIRIDKSKVRREHVLPEIVPLDPREPDVRPAKALVAGAAAC